MNSPRKQRKFHTEVEILTKIDAILLRIKARNCEASDYEGRFRLAQIECADLEAKLEDCDPKDYSELLYQFRTLQGDVRRYQDEAIKKRRIAKGLEDNVLPKLKNTLAAFRTIPMDVICGDDIGVVYQT